MNNKRIISFLLAVGVVVSSISSVTFADVEEDVINAQAKYEEYQKNVDKMTEEIVKFNSEIEQCLGNIEDAESEINTDSATTPNITPAQAMVDKKICDFNGDDKYNAKDRLYITTHRTIKAPNLNNRTDSSRILISAYTE